ncbi:MAG: SCO family protein [Burkholderiales bacterium]
MSKGGVFFALLLGLAVASTAAHEFKIDSGNLGFVPPKPGTYKLNKIMPAPDGKVVNVDGKTDRLSRYTTGMVTLLGFIYTTCPDEKGCPLAYRVFYDLKKQIENSPELYDKIRFVSLSFDPENDTPQVMRLYGGSQLVESTGLKWYFLTTGSRKELHPILDGFGQDVSVLRNPGKDAPRTFTHVLKVFLIDHSGQIREIYSTSYLIPQLVMNDMLTLLLEDGKAAKAASKK